MHSEAQEKKPTRGAVKCQKYMQASSVAMQNLYLIAWNSNTSILVKRISWRTEP